LEDLTDYAVILGGAWNLRGRAQGLLGIVCAWSLAPFPTAIILVDQSWSLAPFPIALLSAPLRFLV